MAPSSAQTALLELSLLNDKTLIQADVNDTIRFISRFGAGSHLH